MFASTDGMACIAYTLISGFSRLKGIQYIICCFLHSYVYARACVRERVCDKGCVIYLSNVRIPDNATPVSRLA